MQTPVLQAGSIPRFLLPKLTWTSTIPRGLGPSRSFGGSIHHPSALPCTPSRPYCKLIPAARSFPGDNSRPSSPAIGVAASCRRQFSMTSRRERDHHFDTLKVVQRLKDEGFTEEQAVAMKNVLSDVIEESIQNLTRTMVPREDQDKAMYEQKVDFAKLRSELLSADSMESSVTRASYERLKNELAKLNARLRDDIQRTQASVRLDLNLEKGRIREESNVQESKIKETEARIEHETAILREKLEAVKFTTLQWLMGVCTGTAALILGAWRLLM